MRASDFGIAAASYTEGFSEQRGEDGVCEWLAAEASDIAVRLDGEATAPDIAVSRENRAWPLADASQVTCELTGVNDAALAASVAGLSKARIERSVHGSTSVNGVADLDAGEPFGFVTRQPAVVFEDGRALFDGRDLVIRLIRKIRGYLLGSN